MSRRRRCQTWPMLVCGLCARDVFGHHSSEADGALAWRAPDIVGGWMRKLSEHGRPSWAQGGLTPPSQAMPHVLGTSGKIVAILFGHPLRSPPRPSPGPASKILWVSRVGSNGDPLKIDAIRDGSNVVATRTVAGGPGPSIINLPSSGWWILSLSWSGHLDRMSIPYYAG